MYFFNYHLDCLEKEMFYTIIWKRISRHYKQDFLCDPRNKADLIANVVTKEVIKRSPELKCVITAGGLAEVTKALSSIPELDLKGLKSTREEADMPLKLHCLHTPSVDVLLVQIYISIDAPTDPLSWWQICTPEKNLNSLKSTIWMCYHSWYSIKIPFLAGHTKNHLSIFSSKLLS